MVVRPVVVVISDGSEAGVDPEKWSLPEDGSDDEKDGRSLGPEDACSVPTVVASLVDESVVVVDVISDDSEAGVEPEKRSLTEDGSDDEKDGRLLGPEDTCSVPAVVSSLVDESVVVVISDGSTAGVEPE